MGPGEDDKPEFSIGPRSNIHARHLSSIFTPNVLGKGVSVQGFRVD